MEWEQNFYRFFPPEHVPFSSPGELCSDHFFQNMSFVKYPFSIISPFILGRYGPCPMLIKYLRFGVLVLKFQKYNTFISCKGCHICGKLLKHFSFFIFLSSKTLSKMLHQIFLLPWKLTVRALLKKGRENILGKPSKRSLNQGERIFIRKFIPEIGSTLVLPKLS